MCPDDVARQDMQGRLEKAMRSDQVRVSCGGPALLAFAESVDSRPLRQRDMTRFAFAMALLFTAPWQEAETVDVRNWRLVDLTAFACQDVTRSSVISRVCYDEANRYLLLQRNGVYDHYCELPKAARDALLNAPSMGQYFSANIRAPGLEASGPYHCAPHKAPSHQ